MKKIIFTFILSSIFSVFLYADGMIITHKSVTEKNISADDIPKIYLGKKTQWSNGDKIVITYISDVSVTGKDFYTTYVGRSIKKFRKFWVKQVFAGNGNAPKTFESASQAYRYVKSHKGALAYVPSGTSTKDVNVLMVDNKKVY